MDADYIGRARPFVPARPLNDARAVSKALPLRCICITGPTACGKTDLALALAERYPAEIVSMDSAMVYRGMDIGTAKPEADVLASVPHHLIDVCDPEEAYSAGRFAHEARGLIGDVSARGKLALVVGGTMLYLKALRDGIARLPARDAATRAALDAEAEAVGWPAMHAQLAAVDPAAAARIEPTDRQRIQRALEVFRLTGRSLSELQRRGRAGEADATMPIETLALIPSDRQQLADAIAQRFRAMVARGFIDEVERLRRRPGLSADSPSMRAVGYRQIWAHLDGRYDWPETEQRAIAATRQLAKRQLTWLRKDPTSERVEHDGPDLLEHAVRRIDAILG